MRKFLNIVVSVCLALFMIGSAVIITLNIKQIYYNDIDKLNIESMSGLSREDIVENYDYLIEYNMSSKVDEFELPNLPSSTGGRIHFEEVRDIFQGIKLAVLVTGAISVLGGIYLALKKEFKFFRNSSLLAILLPVALAIPIAVNFNTCFVMFHEIMFSNDYWIFDPSMDPVIMMLPEAFFMHMGITILLLVLALSVLFQGLYRVLKKKYIKE